MAKTNPNPKTNMTANMLDVAGLLAAAACLAAIIQHVNHLNQVNQHLIAIYLSHTAAPGFTVRPDFQLLPLVPLAALIILAAILVRKRLSPVTLVSLAIFVSSGLVWLFGFHLVHT